jgi:hypothetical protein
VARSIGSRGISFPRHTEDIGLNAGQLDLDGVLLEEIFSNVDDSDLASAVSTSLSRMSVSRRPLEPSESFSTRRVNGGRRAGADRHS